MRTLVLGPCPDAAVEYPESDGQPVAETDVYRNQMMDLMGTIPSGCRARLAGGETSVIWGNHRQGAQPPIGCKASLQSHFLPALSPFSPQHTLDGFGIILSRQEPNPFRLRCRWLLATWHLDPQINIGATQQLRRVVGLSDEFYDRILVPPSVCDSAEHYEQNESGDDDQQLSHVAPGPVPRPRRFGWLGPGGGAVVRSVRHGLLGHVYPLSSPPGSLAR